MKIHDQNIELSNTHKILFRKNNISKGDVIQYYRKISAIMIPHMKDRPLTLHRFPNGIDEKGFYQQEIPEFFPNWIEKASVTKKEGGKIDHVVCNDPATLIYIANQACITPHIWLSRTREIQKPDKMIFDLDPSTKDYSLVVKAAKELKKLLLDLHLTPFLMNTGSRGLHVVVPIIADMNFDEVRCLAKKIAQEVAKKNSDSFTIQHRKDKRGSRVFIDYLRNAYGQTSVAPYSIRSIRGAPVATPLEWSEISSIKFNPQKYHIRNVFRRLGQKGDPWINMYTQAASLQQCTYN
jgi:bifunctional non-homologous end joining protein LigD